MPLSNEIKKNSLDELNDIYDAQYPEKKDLAKALIEEVNCIASDHQESIRLSWQNAKVINSLMEELENISESIECKTEAKRIFNKLYRLISSEKTAEKHANNGSFDNRHFHIKAKAYPTIQMEDNDMLELMPKSTDTIDVLSVIHTGSPDALYAAKLIINPGIAEFKRNEHKRHLMFPMGPGHWQGVFLTKNESDSGKYTLELFDSFGPKAAKSMESVVLNLLKEEELNPHDINRIEFIGPLIEQTDGYSCGDFVCAYSHQKMKEWKAEPKDYCDDLINILEKEGNRDGALRNVTRERSETLNPAPETQRNATQAGSETLNPAPEKDSSRSRSIPSRKYSSKVDAEFTAEFRKNFRLLRLKKNSFNPEQPAYQKINELCLLLEKNHLLYSKGTITPTKFKKQCIFALDQSLDLLGKHRNLSQMIVGHTLAILFLSFFWLIALIKNLAENKGRCTFFSTNSAKRVYALRDTLENMPESADTNSEDYKAPTP